MKESLNILTNFVFLFVVSVFAIILYMGIVGCVQDTIPEKQTAQDTLRYDGTTYYIETDSACVTLK